MKPGSAYYRDLLHRRWRTLSGAVVAGLVGGAGCSTLIILLIHRQLSGVSTSGIALPLMYVGTIALYLTISSVSEYLLLSVAQEELRELRMRLSRRILELPLERVEELGSARIMAALTEDLGRVAESIRKLTTLVLSGSLLAGVCVYLIWLSPLLFGATALLFVVGSQLYRWPLRRLQLLQRYWTRLREGYDTLLRQFEGLARGTKELLMHKGRREEFVDKGMAEICLGMRDDSIRAGTWQNLLFRMGDVLYYGILGVALFVLPTVAFVEPEVITGYVIAGLYAMVPLSSILNFGPNFGEAHIALDRLAQMGVIVVDREEPNQAPDESKPDSWPPEQLSRPAIPPHLRLDAISYEYRHGEELPFQLGPLTLELPAGELTFLTGGNGSGKTTLFKILCGLYLPAQGSLTFNGHEVTPATIEDYRRHFSVVFSDFHLFDRFYGQDRVEMDQRSVEWLKRLELDGKVHVRDGRISTTDLSQGQRKRLALMTAFLEDRPVYLFDEWAADQDPHFKEIFYTELLPELKAKGRTVLAITHDDRWYGIADRVLKLSDGQLVSGHVQPASGKS